MAVDVQGGPTHHRASRGRLTGWGAGDDGGFLLLITLGDTQVDSVESSHFLGIIITRDLKWELSTTDLRTKAPKRLFSLRQAARAHHGSALPAFVESILAHSIITWFFATAARDLCKLQWVIRSAERVIGCPLPTLRRARRITADLPSGRRRWRLLKAANACHTFLPLRHQADK